MTEMIVLHLTSEQKDSLRRREGASAKADLDFRACPLCAWMTWSSTQHEGSGQTTAKIDSGPCSKCTEMRFRHGELFDYVLYLIRGQRLLHDMAERAKASKASA